ncbi:hypothetical protein QTQ03_16760 [Micromonospora sp. WMMA1363]|uniref:hypothetical protein n=1 Tax=Micromonospora sp. WMMA1363 TaxID=3053985 RepID=UPI00259D20C0|nr:hypothetical protein [Micromonospora sp. WMMA1363]MDM4721170.1 hypothetical protein [Micromonospora sp. WMMA1363]
MPSHNRRSPQRSRTHLISLIRTAVPVAVGALLAWLASRAGIVLDEGSSTALTAGVVAAAVAVYYALVRALESRWPWFGVLLGKPAAPSYEVTSR